VDKEDGKNLISDSEIERLANVDNYDDTEINAQIADIYNRCGGGKNVFDFKNTSHSGSVGNEYTKNEDSFIITDSTNVWSRTAFKLGTLSKGKYYVSFKVSDLECESNTTKVLVGPNSDGQQPVGVSGNITENKTYTFEFNVTSTTQIYYLVLYGNYSNTVYHNKVTFSEIMVYSSTIKNNTYVPYIPTNSEIVTSLDTTNTNVTNVKSQVAINQATLGTQCKNLLKCSATTETKYGVTFTINNDGTVTINGTSTEQFNFYYGKLQTPGKYRLNGYPDVVDMSLYRLMGQLIKTDGTTTWFGDTQDQPFTLGLNTNNSEVNVYIKIYSGKTYENVVFSPMIRSADVVDSTYAPYQPPLQTAIDALQETTNNHIKVFEKTSPKPKIAFDRRISFIVKPLTTNEYRVPMRLLVTSQYGGEGPKDILLTINTKTGSPVGKGVLVGYQQEGSFNIYKKSLDDGTVLYSVDVGRSSSYGNMEIYINRNTLNYIEINSSSTLINGDTEGASKISLWSVQDQLVALEARIAALETAITAE
jgi:hypothetical protein